MRTLTRMTIALTAAGLVIFGAYGVYLVRAERRDLVAATEREVQMLGRSLRTAAENALRDRQIEDIREALYELEILGESVDVVVYSPAGERMAATLQTVDPNGLLDSAARVAMGERRPSLRYDPPGVSGRMILALPLLADDASLLGGLILVRPLDDLRRDLQRTRRAVSLSVLLFVLTSAGLGWALGTAYIARPLARTAAAMRAVRSGDLSSALRIEHHDEIGALAEEFNAMVAELRHARTQLEEEIESRRLLQRTLQEADKLISIGQLSAGLAHEIGSPLQVINGRARALAAAAGNEAETRRVAEILIGQSDRITRIVEQLLRFARKRPAQITAIDLPSTVRTVLDLLEYEARRRGVRITMEVPEALAPLLADADQIQQLVLNLVSNALNATTSGGKISITIAAGPGGDGTGPAVVRLIVSDDGCGIATADRERLFEPFFTTRSLQGGTGLGLAVVKSIVTDHGGTIAVESESGHGSRFTVELPA
jgi:signal transduction histidine kinase